MESEEVEVIVISDDDEPVESLVMKQSPTFCNVRPPAPLELARPVLGNSLLRRSSELIKNRVEEKRKKRMLDPETPRVEKKRRSARKSERSEGFERNGLNEIPEMPEHNDSSEVPQSNKSPERPPEHDESLRTNAAVPQRNRSEVRRSRAKKSAQTEHAETDFTVNVDDEHELVRHTESRKFSKNLNLGRKLYERLKFAEEAAANETLETEANGTLVPEDEVSSENVRYDVPEYLTRDMDRKMEQLGLKTHASYEEHMEYVRKEIEQMTNVITENREWNEKNFNVEDAACHWDAENLSQEEHAQRMTRWDVAMMEAFRLFKLDDLKCLEQRSLTLNLTDRAGETREMLKQIGEIVDEKRDTNDWFSFCRFTLADIAEWKGQTFFPGKLPFREAIIKFPRSRRTALALISKHKRKSTIQNYAEKHGVDSSVLFEKLERIGKKNYTLPKGKLLTRLILNICHHLTFDTSSCKWDVKDVTEKAMFDGIPHNAKGEKVIIS